MKCSIYCIQSETQHDVTGLFIFTGIQQICLIYFCIYGRSSSVPIMWLSIRDSILLQFGTQYFIPLRVMFSKEDTCRAPLFLSRLGLSHNLHFLFPVLISFLGRLKFPSILHYLIFFHHSLIRFHNPYTTASIP